MATMAIFSLRMQTFGRSPISNCFCFVTLKCVKDPNVQEVADGTPCKLRRSFDASPPAFRAFTKTLIVNPMKSSAICIFTILLNSGFAVDLSCQIQNVAF
jgi:hypothetical protein